MSKELLNIRLTMLRFNWALKKIELINPEDAKLMCGIVYHDNFIQKLQKKRNYDFRTDVYM